MDLRPVGSKYKELPFFLRYANQKCTQQCIGINYIGGIPKKIAEFLKLPNAKEYTGHCFRRTSATILVDSGGDLLSLKRLGGWKSSAVAEGYVNESFHNQSENSNKITNAIINNKETKEVENSKTNKITINQLCNKEINLVQQNNLKTPNITLNNCNNCNIIFNNTN